ncbi:MAG: hypothetical protein WA941_18900 [Nitrososphaeraceae archaeon]
MPDKNQQQGSRLPLGRGEEELVDAKSQTKESRRERAEQGCKAER